MKLSGLLDEIRYGKIVVEETTNKENILKRINEDTGELVVSQRLSDMVELIAEGNEDTVIVQRLKKMIGKYSDIEDKYFDGKEFSKAYSKMKFDSLREDYKIIVESLNDRKLYKRFDNKNLAKALAAAKVGVKYFGEDLDFGDTNNSLLNTYINEEVDFVNNIIE